MSNSTPTDLSSQWPDLYRLAVESAYDAVLVTDAELDLPGPRIVYCNPAFTRMTGYTLDEIMGSTPRILQGEATDRTVLDELRRTLERGEPFEGRVVNYRRDGTPFDLEWRTSAMHDADGRTVSYVSIQRDVTAQNRLLQQLRQEADHDWLTAAYNRRSAERVLEKEIEREQRYGVEFSVILIDIDCFKTVNDRYGHILGDEVLQHLSERLVQRLRRNDVFARWGGEEFLIVLPQTDSQCALQVARSIEAHITSTDFPDRIDITVSMGVAGHRAGGNVEQLIERADRALYMAKSNGRARIEFDSD